MQGGGPREEAKPTLVNSMGRHNRMSYLWNSLSDSNGMERNGNGSTYTACQRYP